MNLRSVAVLACRVLAIVALISVIQASAFLLPRVYDAFHPSASGMESPIGDFPLSPWLTLVYVSPVALLLLFAGFLWTQAEFVAAKMMGERNEKLSLANVDLDAPTRNAQSVAFSILGAYVLTIALPRLAQLLVHAWNVSSQDATLRQDWTGFAPNLVFAAVEIALALWLLFGARGLVTLLADVRHLGRDVESLPAENNDKSVSFRPEK